MRPEFAPVPFEDRATAEGNLERLAERMAPQLVTPLASLLGPSPDPDGALNLLDRYVQAAPAPVLAEIVHSPTALTYLVAIFGYSHYLAETFLAEPALALQLARDRNFTKLKSAEELIHDFARFRATSDELWLSAQLAHFKRRNYLRIALKDVLGRSTLGETTLELSLLADVILTNALEYCEHELVKRYGYPQFRDQDGRIAHAGFSIVSLGKLGGNELNYSSDIDLLFLYSRDGETSGGTERGSVISNREFFVRLAHGIVRTVTQMTPHGPVFRVDLRLRPEGEQGDLAISASSALEYYERRARGWELQMLIKARHSAGDIKLTREFLHGVEPYVYGTPADFEAVESVLCAREKITRRAHESRNVDVKLHRGGIRDIEFLTQCLQRLYGGEDPWVRSGGTLHALRKLNDKGHLADGDFADLTTSYGFLRQLEHVIQLDQGRQTHGLPSEPGSLDRLARRIGMEATPGVRPGERLLDRVQGIFDAVDGIYQRVIHPRAGAASRAAFGLQPPTVLPSDQGPHSYDATLRFLEQQAPELAAMLREASLPERVRPNATRLFAALVESPERFRLARNEPQLVGGALAVVAGSDYLAELLIRQPDAIVALDFQADAGQNPTPDQFRIPHFYRVAALPQPFGWATQPGLALREKMGLLRRTYWAEVLALGAKDLIGLDSIFTSLSRWSALAGRSVATSLMAAAESLGETATLSPVSNGADARRPDTSLPLVVLGLGRLGLNEFDLASDADLVFVVASSESGQSQDNIALWTHVAAKTIDVLSSYTCEGSTFAVDTRLRPRGQEGELVVTEEELVEYLRDSAQAWEALTYLKACPVAGNPGPGARLIAKLHAALAERFARHPNLESDLKQMRRRLEREVQVPPSNTKTAPGGYYDIDFAVSCLRLRCPGLEIAAGANIPMQIASLAQAGALSEADARALREGAAFLRSVDHAIRLVTGRAAAGLPEHVGHAEAVENLARRWGLARGGEKLAERLRAVQHEVRDTYRRLIGPE